MKFKVHDNFFNKVPNAYFGIVIVKDFNNNKDYSFIKELLEKNVKNAYNNYKNIKVKESDLITPYREAFKLLNINPNKYMCSIEALMTRISKGNNLPCINPIVDLGNALSVKYSLPLGVHDIDKFSSNIEIRESNKNDEFIPFGSNIIEHLDDSEIIYVSGNDVKTRRWTWRQGENSKITNDSKNLFIPIDGFSDINKDKVISLQNELVKILDNIAVKTITGYVDVNNKEFIWN